jgi:hexosaminidase
MKKFIFFLLLFTSLSAISQTNLNIIPKPVEIKEGSGDFTLTKSTSIIANAAESHNADMLNFYLKKLYGFTLAVKNNSLKKDSRNSIILENSKKAADKKDEYHLAVTKDKINIEGISNEAVFYGIQTLLQLLPTDNSSSINNGFQLPQVTITDYPRFQYRGMHLDVGRHFFGPNEVKKYIDYLAFHKFNTFHWHLTEDQGWRIEIKRYPKLTSVGGFRNGTVIGHYPGTGNDSIHYGGFYTQKEVKEIVKYAQDRYIIIIPEIEMPGHSSAAIAAYPQLSCFPDEDTQIKPNIPWAGSRKVKQVQQTWGVFPDVYCPTEYTFKFIENVLDEVMTLFPSKYIHIGGDECPKTYWKRSEFCQKLIKEKNLKDEEGLQSYFIRRIEKYVNSKGRKIIGWDEILQGGLAPNATIMSWRGESGGIAAAQQHHDVIMTPGKYVYFDHAQIKNEDSVTIGGYLPIDTVYNYEPVPKELKADEAKYVLGAQGNVWTEYIGNESKLEYMIFPRMSALSEVLWSPKELRDLNDFDKRLPAMIKRYDLWGTNYCKVY